MNYAAQYADSIREISRLRAKLQAITLVIHKVRNQPTQIHKIAKDGLEGDR